MTSALKHDINRTAIGPWALNTVYNVDCLVGLAPIPSDTIDVIVTSPPYWGQRDGRRFGDRR